jgi:hypothetical protein
MLECIPDRYGLLTVKGYEDGSIGVYYADFAAAAIATLVAETCFTCRRVISTAINSGAAITMRYWPGGERFFADFAAESGVALLHPRLCFSIKSG